MDLFNISETAAREEVSKELWRLEKIANVLAIRLRLVRKHGVDNVKVKLNMDRMYRDIQPCIDHAIDILGALKQAEHEFENAGITGDGDGEKS
jgi:hypothetical protein